MRVRKHFKVSPATIDYIITDFNLNRIVDKDLYFKNCVIKRMIDMSNEYDEKLDKILSFLILNCNFERMPIQTVTRIVNSLSKVTTALSKGFMSIIK